MSVDVLQQKTNIIKLVYFGGIQKEKGINVLRFEVQDDKIIILHEKGVKIIYIEELSFAFIQYGYELLYNSDFTVRSFLLAKMLFNNYSEEAKDILGEFKEEDISQLEIFYRKKDEFAVNAISGCAKNEDILALYQLIKSKLPNGEFQKKDLSLWGNKLPDIPTPENTKSKSIFTKIKTMYSNIKDLIINRDIYFD